MRRTKRRSEPSDGNEPAARGDERRSSVGVPLFVYGTLLRGEPGHELLASAQYLGRARTLPRFELVDCGEYPALVRGGEDAVAGEIYDVGAEALAALDVYEDCPRLFVRELIEVAREDGVTSSCEVYLMPAPRALGRARIAGGDWKTRGR